MTELTENTSNTTKKMKKGSCFLKGLKKLLCCCWCKDQQENEEADEYVVVDPPCQGEGEKGDGVCEESDSLADSTSETAQSLPVTCGHSPESESVQSLSEECEALEDPVCEGGQDPYIDEDLIAKIYALIDEETLKTPVTTECVEEEQGKTDGQTESSAKKRRRRRRKKKVRQEEKGDGGEWRLVC